MAETTVSYDAGKYPNFKEFLWFEAYEQELLRQYSGRHIVIKDEQVIGDYGSRKLARQQTLKNHKPGTFIIHFCAENEPRRVPKLIDCQLISVNAN
jgi:hypothetical protein